MPSWIRALSVALPLSAVAALAAAAPAPPASFVSYADEPPPAPLPPASPITDHLALNAGFFWGSVRTFGQIGPRGGTPPGTALIAEDTLGVTNRAYQPQLEVMFRLEDRNRLRVDWLDLRRNGASVLGSGLQFGDQSYLVGQPIQSMLDWRQMDVTYTYSFLRRQRFELGAGIGLHFIEAEARVQSPSSPQTADYSEAGPFATLAGDGTWLIDRHWSFNARAQYMRLTLGSYRGELEDMHADFQYRWKRNFALGAGYDYTRRELDALHSDPSGELQLRITGPRLFLRVSY
jgi:hypothetical protein